MNKNVIYVIIGIVILFAAAIFLVPWMINKGKKASTEKPVSSVGQPVANIAGPTDRCDTAYYAKAYAKELREARVAYQDLQDAMDCYQIDMTKQNQNVSQTNGTSSTKVARKSTGASKRTTTRRTSSPQMLESEFLGAEQPNVSTIVKEGGTRQVEFCVKLEENRHWPQLELDLPDRPKVSYSVPNPDGTGHNIRMHPVNNIGDVLYGPTADKRIFVNADLLDKHGAESTGVLINSDFNNWASWVPALRETINGVDYYVAYY